MFFSRFGRYEWFSGCSSCCAIRSTMFEPDRPMITSKPTAPAASLAIASSAELYVAICDLAVEYCFSKRLTSAGSM